MDEDFRSYVESIGPERRPLFDRLHGIVVAAHPEAEVALAYGMPAYRVGKRRLNSACGRTASRSTAGGAIATGGSPSAIPSS